MLVILFVAENASPFIPLARPFTTLASRNPSGPTRESAIDLFEIMTLIQKHSLFKNNIPREETGIGGDGGSSKELENCRKEYPLKSH